MPEKESDHLSTLAILPYRQVVLEVFQGGMTPSIETCRGAIFFYRNLIMLTANQFMQFAHFHIPVVQSSDMQIINIYLYRAHTIIFYRNYQLIIHQEQLPLEVKNELLLRALFYNSKACRSLIYILQSSPYDSFLSELSTLNIPRRTITFASKKRIRLIITCMNSSDQSYKFCLR